MDTSGFGFVEREGGDDIEVELFEQGAFGAAGEDIVDGAFLAVVEGAVDVAEEWRDDGICLGGGGNASGLGGAGSGEFDDDQGIRKEGTKDPDAEEREGAGGEPAAGFTKEDEVEEAEGAPEDGTEADGDGGLFWDEGDGDEGRRGGEAARVFPAEMGGKGGEVLGF